MTEHKHICDIEHYKQEVMKREGRRLDGCQAAMEWTDNHPRDFPRIEDATV